MIQFIKNFLLKKKFYLLIDNIHISVFSLKIIINKIYSEKYYTLNIKIVIYIYIFIYFY